jgi:hypothetical protein
MEMLEAESGESPVSVGQEMIEITFSLV